MLADEIISLPGLRRRGRWCGPVPDHTGYAVAERLAAAMPPAGTMVARRSSPGMSLGR